MVDRFTDTERPQSKREFETAAHEQQYARAARRYSLWGRTGIVLGATSPFLFYALATVLEMPPIPGLVTIWGLFLLGYGVDVARHGTAYRILFRHVDWSQTLGYGPDLPMGAPMQRTVNMIGAVLLGTLMLSGVWFYLAV